MLRQNEERSRSFFSDLGKVIDVIQELILKIDTLMSLLETAIAAMQKQDSDTEKADSYAK